jgi:hypothetical protein
MPLVKVHVLKSRSLREIDALLDKIHTVIVDSFGVPQRDRYQILHEHEKSHVRFLDTGLDIPRTEKFVVLESSAAVGPKPPREPSTPVSPGSYRFAAKSSLPM